MRIRFTTSPAFSGRIPPICRYAPIRMISMNEKAVSKTVVMINSPHSNHILYSKPVIRFPVISDKGKPLIPHMRD